MFRYSHIFAFQEKVKCGQGRISVSALKRPVDSIRMGIDETDPMFSDDSIST